MPLGTAANFGVLGATTVTNTGASSVTGNLGVSPGTAITGFPPGTVTGTTHAGDPVAAQAQADAAVANTFLAGLPCDTTLTADLGTLTLTPGVYCFGAAATLTGTLTLDGEGDPNATFVFRIGSTLTTAALSSVVMIDSAQGCNVYWQVGSSATLGSGTALAGNILAAASITMTTGSSLSGRAIALGAAVTMDTSTAAACFPLAPCPAITLAPALLPGGSVGTPYAQSVVASGSAALPYTFAASSGSLPAGLVLDSNTGAISGNPLTPGPFPFTITATDALGCTGSTLYAIAIVPVGCFVVMVSPLVLPMGQVGVAYNATLTASPAGVYTFSVVAGSLPAGLSLNAATGVISGTPLAGGTSPMTIAATSAGGCIGAQAYLMGISSEATAIPVLGDSVLLLLAFLVFGAGLASMMMNSQRN